LQWTFVEPTQGVFNYTEGEIVTSKAKKHGLYLRCHALVWHSQLAPWVDAATANWTPDQLRKIIVDHITKVAGHWKGQCYAWDVVNEALNEDGTYRESVFYNVLGEEYIKLAFKTAAKVDPKAKLYYNDYNLESPSAKTEGAQRIVKLLRKEGIKIDGVGLQTHLVAESPPTLDQHIDAIKGFADLGVEVALTEVDIRLTTPSTPANLALQRQAYKNVSFPASCPSAAHANSPRSLVLASRLRAALASPFGISMTPSAGCPLSSRPRATLRCGSRTLPSIPPMMESLRP
jgi:endo-1,4-beta-xylanase